MNGMQIHADKNKLGAASHRQKGGKHSQNGSNMSSKKWVLSLLAVILLACTSQVQQTVPASLPSTPLPTLTNTTTIENEGVVCFQEYENSSTVDGYFQPRGCFSSSCWQLIEKSVKVRVLEDENQLRFYTRVTLRDFSIINGEHVECTADCSHVGDINFSLSNVPRKKYSVWLGEKQIGEFSNMQKAITQPTTCMGQEY